MFVDQSRRDVHTECAHCFGGTFCVGAGAAGGAGRSIAQAASAGIANAPATTNPRTPAQTRIFRSSTFACSYNAGNIPKIGGARSGREAHWVHLHLLRLKGGGMLQLTESAATTLADTRSQIGVPDHFGLRIFRGVSDGKAAFAFDFVEAPEDGDEVGEVEETRYFVAPEVAAPLAAAVLDAEPTPEGPQLTLKRQPQ